MLGASESERLRVTALNLFHPTASPLSKEVPFHVVTQPLNRSGLTLPARSNPHRQGLTIGNKPFKRKGSVSYHQPMVLIIVAQKAKITQPAPHDDRTRTIGHQTIILENAGRWAFHLDEKEPFNRLVNEGFSNRGQVDGIDKFEAEWNSLFNGQPGQDSFGFIAR
jgi:hypothetical protein